MARLTGFSKLLITLLILAGLFFGGRYLLYNTEFGSNLQDTSGDFGFASDDNSASSLSSDGDDVLRVERTPESQ